MPVAETPEGGVYRYYPNTSPVPEFAAAEIRGRSFKILAQVELDDADAQGVLIANGARFGGHALFLKDRKLWYVNNFLGIPPEQQLVSPDEAGSATMCSGWSSPRKATASTVRPSAPPPSTSTTWPSRRASGRPSPATSRCAGRGSPSAGTAPTRSPRRTARRSP